MTTTPLTMAAQHMAAAQHHTLVTMQHAAGTHEQYVLGHIHLRCCTV